MSGIDFTAWKLLLDKICDKYGLTVQFCDYGDTSKNPRTHNEFWFLSRINPYCGASVWIRRSGFGPYEYCHNLMLPCRESRDDDGYGIINLLMGSTIVIGKYPIDKSGVRISFPVCDTGVSASQYELILAVSGIL